MNNNAGIKRRVLRDDVVEHIVNCILTGNLKPGAKIVETRISRELNVSQGAVREAIRDLTAKGFVEAEPYKGSRVKVFSEKEMYDYIAVRREIEPIAVGWALQRNSIDVADLYSVVEIMKSGVAKRDIDVIRKSDIEFHRRIVRSSGNNSLIRAWEILSNDYWVYTLAERKIHLNSGLSDYAEKHEYIVAAIETGDIDLTKERLRQHFICKSDCEMAS
ncbi:GntR family transcriptional regulator [Maridesulfovibrio sp.]|uniref:GntR family transcriptional regulator n=1 Tax=Maridesulfovibrio sp. TaxID=2795000 RepID=UPI002A187FE2|nr:GntR family transcriptional regulator [Maridesulfovibrio sp.]